MNSPTPSDAAIATLLRGGPLALGSGKVVVESLGVNARRLLAVLWAARADLAKRKEVKGLFTFFAANYPQYELVIDNQLAMQKGVSISRALENLDIVVGSTYEQGFIRFGRFFKVYVQALPEYRRTPSDILDLFVENDRGEMVPYSAFMTLRTVRSPGAANRSRKETTPSSRCCASST